MPLDEKSVAPALYARFTDCMSSRLVCIKIGTWAQSGNSRSALQTSKPLMPGMTTSSTTQSAQCSRNSLKAASPSAAVMTRNPAISNAVPTSKRAPGSSSTTRIVAGMTLCCSNVFIVPFGLRCVGRALARQRGAKLLILFADPVHERGGLRDATFAHQVLAFLGDHCQPGAPEIRG